MPGSRAMFWRILRRQIFANRGRLLVVLVALAAGAAITAALLNLQVDAKRRLTTEFRAFGANVIITPHSSGGTSNEQTMSEGILKRVAWDPRDAGINVEPFLYVMADISAEDGRSTKVVVVGGWAGGLWMGRTQDWQFDRGAEWNASSCIVGSGVFSHLKLSGSPSLKIVVGDKQYFCQTSQTLSTGGAEDNQIFLPLSQVQRLASLPGRISLVGVHVPGRTDVIKAYVDTVQQSLPDLDVRPIRQFSEAQGKIYEKISGLLTATVVLVLILTALCVLAAMTNVAMERRNDVGLMKAIGGATRRVLRLFLTEAALLGLVGGLIGAAVGILLSIGLGKAVFGIAARPRLIVYPISVGLTIIVAIASSYPLRRLASIRPASVFRGEA